MDKNPPAMAGDMGSIPGLGRSHMQGGNYAWAPQLLKPPLESPQAETHTLEPAGRNKRKASCSNEDPEQPKKERVALQNKAVWIWTIDKGINRADLRGGLNSCGYFAGKDWRQKQKGTAEDEMVK